MSSTVSIIRTVTAFGVNRHTGVKILQNRSDRSAFTIPMGKSPTKPDRAKKKTACVQTEAAASRASTIGNWCILLIHGRTVVDTKPRRSI